MLPRSEIENVEVLRVVLIDDHPLRRASLAQFLTAGAKAEGFSFEIREAGTSADQVERPAEVRLALLSIGGTPAAAPEILGKLEEQTRRMPDVPVVVLSDREESAGVVAALRAGACGFVTTRVDPCVAIRALKFVIDGGVFFPPSALLDAPSPSPAAPLVGLNGAAVDAGPSPQAGGEALTARQAEVLRPLRQGQSNKLIARELRMCEATVKVHVRQIMRKLRVSSRTQAALCALEPSPHESALPAPTRGGMAVPSGLVRS